MNNEENFQKYIDNILEIEKENRWENNYSIGNFIDDLKKFNSKACVIISPFNLYPTGFCSYRGYYSDLALEYTTENNCMTAGKLLKKAEECIGKTFIGYKGGEFEMAEDTTLWLSNYGKCTNLLVTGIKDVYDDGSFLEITYRIKENE